jgi:TIR domain
MTSEPTAPRIFISYARADGRTLAQDLRWRFSQDHGFKVWQDLAEMEAGKDWWQQIKDAIDQVEYLVLIMTRRRWSPPLCKTSGATRGSRGPASSP